MFYNFVFKNPWNLRQFVRWCVPFFMNLPNFSLFNLFKSPKQSLCDIYTSTVSTIPCFVGCFTIIFLPTPPYFIVTFQIFRCLLTPFWTSGPSTMFARVTLTPPSYWLLHPNLCFHVNGTPWITCNWRTIFGFPWSPCFFQIACLVALLLLLLRTVALRYVS